MTVDRQQLNLHRDLVIRRKFHSEIENCIKAPLDLSSARIIGQFILIFLGNLLGNSNNEKSSILWKIFIDYFFEICFLHRNCVLVGAHCCDLENIARRHTVWKNSSTWGEERRNEEENFLEMQSWKPFHKFIEDKHLIEIQINHGKKMFFVNTRSDCFELRSLEMGERS